MGSSFPEEKVYKVSELTQLVKLTLENQFANIQVLGEASGVVLASSGHLYFTLKDAAGAMKVVMFRGNLQKSTLGKLENGQQIIVRGVLSVYPARGEMQIIASDMRLQGIGDIFAALEKLKKAYQEKGYFDPAFIAALMAQRKSGKTNHSQLLMGVWATQIWDELFLQNFQIPTKTSANLP